MRFTLSIELGNDAMQTQYDIARALIDTGSRLLRVPNASGRTPLDGDSGIVRDDNGNRVGGWHVEE